MHLLNDHGTRGIVNIAFSEDAEPMGLLWTTINQFWFVGAESGTVDRELEFAQAAAMAAMVYSVLLFTTNKRCVYAWMC